MADTLTIPLTPEAAAKLRRMAADGGETVEALAQQLLEDAADEIAEFGDDAELARRIARWRETKASALSADVHAWLDSLGSDAPKAKPLTQK